MKDHCKQSTQTKSIATKKSDALFALFNSITICLIEAPWWLATLALIYIGPVLPYFGYATVFMVAGAFISMLIVGFGSSWRGTIWLPQDIPTAILAVTTAQIISTATSSVSPGSLFMTIAALVAISTLVTGITFYCLGLFRLGNLVRYLPYPVLAGFLGGTGWLLLKAGADVAMGAAYSGAYWQLTGIVHGLPAILLAIAAYLVGMRIKHPLAFPALLLVSTLFFHLAASISGASHAELLTEGWMFTALNSQVAHAPLSWSDLQTIQWQTLWQHSSSILVIAIGSVIAMLLNSSGFELQVDREFDVNSDMRATGKANILSAMVCGFPGYLSPAASFVNARQGQQLPLTGPIAALLAGMLIWFALPLMTLVPLFVFGATLAYIGVLFVVEWVFGSYKRLSRGEYSVVLLIILAIGVFGLLPGVVAGLLMAILLFLISFSRVDVVRRHLTGIHQQSRVTRSVAERDQLEQLGRQTQIFQLQGYVFFGTANRLLSQIRKQTDDISTRFLILDFERVTGIDSTATSSFAKLQRDLAKKGARLTFVNLSTNDQSIIARQFERQLDCGATGTVEGQREGTTQDTTQGTVQIFDTLDHALQSIETEQLQNNFSDNTTAAVSLQSYLADVLPDANNFERLLSLLERKVMPKGSYLIRQGTPGTDLYFFEKGSITVQLATDDGSVLRLETLEQGVAGELAFYLHKKRTASVVCDSEVTTYKLTRERLEELEAHHPAEANTLHRLIVNLLALRVTHLLGVVNTLRD